MIYKNRLFSNVIYTFLIAFAAFIPHSLKAEDDEMCQLTYSVYLCMGSKNQAGYIAAKSSLITYKNDPEIILFLKQVMCCCFVDSNVFDEMNKISDDVIIESKNLFFIGVAWMQKCRISWILGDDKNALIYSEIALTCLKESERICGIEDENYTQYFEFWCHFYRAEIYKKRGENDKYEVEKKIVEKYKRENLRNEI